MPEQLSADIVVIGSGVCGSLSAHRLATQGASVLILEAGPRVSRDQLVLNYRNGAFKGNWMDPYPFVPWAPSPNFHPDNGYLVQAGPYPYPAEYVRIVGGTTWHWAAHCWRVLPNDMKIKTLYGVGRDWPITYDELEPFYYEAEVKMGVSGGPGTGSPRSKPYPMEPMPEPWAMRRIRERLAPGGYEVITNPQGRTSRPYDGRPACAATITASRFVRSTPNIPGGLRRLPQQRPAPSSFPMPLFTGSSLIHRAALRLSITTIPIRIRPASQARRSFSRRTGSKVQSCCCCRPATNTRTGWRTVPTRLAATCWITRAAH